MRTVRLTCKECDTLSKNRSFSKMHIGKLRAVKEVGKRKHQNDLEKQRCDQNMSSLVSLNKRGTVWW
ncbi:BnaA09g31170D [Brassica napus]|uniref:BnaA09g31170D protein n=1 Tax=Brassica napus TaxID=3708 RepID=A0A078HZT7_BRANA|nr:BnaA09g31170D [Brassica napus]